MATATSVSLQFERLSMVCWMAVRLVPVLSQPQNHIVVCAALSYSMVWVRPSQSDPTGRNRDLNGEDLGLDFAVGSRVEDLGLIT